MNPLYYIDFYKVGHVQQYPTDTEQVWSNWTPRSSRVEGQNTVVLFGLQYFMQKYLIERFTKEFFSRPIKEILGEYNRIISATLGISKPVTRHIEQLHEMGYLPIRIYAIPEGFSTPLNVPHLVVTNTVDHAYWVPNYLETLMSSVLWKPSTSATTAQRYRKLFIKYAHEAGEEDLGFVDWMGHDFSFRGMSSPEDAILSGMGHLLSFSGTDTIPAILAAHTYYGAEFGCGGSVPATEHSVMSAGTQEGELETMHRLLTEVYPSGILSIVSDTWDLWKVLTEFVPKLRKVIASRKGKLVIRPDSGDPARILCGDPGFEFASHRYTGLNLKHHPAYYGTLRLLAQALGVDDKRHGLPLIQGAGAIYGDSISYERADDILGKTVRELKLSPYNLVFGIGSFTYEYVTRDTYGFAMKATAVRRKGKVIDIFKSPITDFGGKVSHRGIPAVYRSEESTEERPEYFVVQGATDEQLRNCALDLVFEDGAMKKYSTFQEIRKRARA